MCTAYPARNISRLLRWHAHFRRRISRVVRMDSRSAATGSLLAVGSRRIPHQDARYPASVFAHRLGRRPSPLSEKWPASAGMGGRHPPEWPAGMDQNWGPKWPGGLTTPNDRSPWHQYPLNPMVCIDSHRILPLRGARHRLIADRLGTRSNKSPDPDGGLPLADGRMSSSRGASAKLTVECSFFATCVFKSLRHPSRGSSPRVCRVWHGDLGASIHLSSVNSVCYVILSLSRAMPIGLSEFLMFPGSHCRAVQQNSGLT
jgi:hypothetical protein